MFGNKAKRAEKKAAKKAVGEVLRKYIGTTNWRTLGSEGVFLVGAVGLAGLVDVICGLGGALATVGAVLAGGGGAIDMMRKVRKYNKLEFVENRAGQKYEAKHLVVNTLNEMEAQLRLAFNRASMPEAPPERKEIFKNLAVEIAEDARKLAPAFSIVAGGPYGFGTEKYEFIVGENNPSPGYTELVTLTQAMKDFGQPLAKPEDPKVKVLQEEITGLKTRLEKIEGGSKLKKLFKKPW